ncbi:hypothetical protein GWD52_21000 [Enterobacteriaceae bacterium 4M9]|nr:hypothetical protein [Enterobacteriaceae bacterium 4M9]
MNITVTSSYFITRLCSEAGRIKIIAEDVQIEQTNNIQEILIQLDQKEIIDFMEKQGFIISKHEAAA